MREKINPITNTFIDPYVAYGIDNIWPAALLLLVVLLLWAELLPWLEVYIGQQSIKVCKALADELLKELPLCHLYFSKLNCQDNASKTPWLAIMQ